MTSIGVRVFENCTGLTLIVVQEGNTKYDSRNNCNAIIESSSNKLIAGCKNTIIPNSVNSIGGVAFYGCTGLTSITIPNSVTSIGSSAFYGCTGLTSVTIPNSVTSIGASAFKDCTNLTSITIPESVTKLYDNTFEGCSNLKSAVVRAEIMEGFAFYNSGLESLTLGKEVREIAANTIIWDFFSNIRPFTNLKHLVFENCDDAIVIDGVKAYFEDNHYSGINPFEDSPIEEIYIGRNISFGGDYISRSYYFWGYDYVYDSENKCYFGNWRQVPQLTSATIGSKVSNIREGMFLNCTSLNSITIPNSVTSIGQNAFYGCI